MSTITPSQFATLHPVHHLILDELIASAPLSVLTLCSSVHRRTLPVLYADICASPAVFSGLRLKEGYERTVEALKSTKTIRVRDFTSIEALYSLAGAEREQASVTSPSSPANNSHPYPRRYTNLFLSLDSLELELPALETSKGPFVPATYHGYLEQREILARPPEESMEPLSHFSVRRLSEQLPNGVQKIVFHLDEGGSDYWHEVRQHLLYQRPREAVIIVKGTISADGALLRRLFWKMGLYLPTESLNAERLTVFVDTDKPLDQNDRDQVQRYVIPVSEALAEYAQRLAWRIRQENRALADGYVEMRLVDHVEIHMPLFGRVLEEMSEEGRKQLYQLVSDGRLVVRDREESLADGV
ncbi:hypothetical protein L198_02479 [Cryptococcus wingfieldii CBS 7118]|uniref:Uncharacterized protein n=1 Tax=Cryptococcus wingfieldii CBS 7118 TaxID=1295528 RepID=A0A1E3JRW1_9TREE|nr:hypothetical protein L198_02479 [Cryptococcus wingfieldii CBS 7118]ODO03628.1 hypothetical protein L198_02479 [Cryptococcus wingfieldii CBS 7118]